MSRQEGRLLREQVAELSRARGYESVRRNDVGMMGMDSSQE